MIDSKANNWLYAADGKLTALDYDRFVFCCEVAGQCKRQRFRGSGESAGDDLPFCEPQDYPRAVHIVTAGLVDVLVRLMLGVGLWSLLQRWCRNRSCGWRSQSEIQELVEHTVFHLRPRYGGWAFVLVVAIIWQFPSCMKKS